eukprot:s5573_g2.t1
MLESREGGASVSEPCHLREAGSTGTKLVQDIVPYDRSKICVVSELARQFTCTRREGVLEVSESASEPAVPCFGRRKPEALHPPTQIVLGSTAHAG